MSQKLSKTSSSSAKLRLRLLLVAVLCAFAGILALFVGPTTFSADPSQTADKFNAPGPGVVNKETGAAGEDIYIVFHQAPSLAQY